MWEVDSGWYQQAKTFHFGLKLLVGLLIILFCTALFVDSAYAAVVQSPYDGVVWGIGVVEKPNGSSMESYNPVEGCIVNAPNAFSAACFAVGGNPATLTSDQKALLSNASTGGDFYTFCQNFANYGGSFDSPDDWYIPKFYDVWNMLENLYGDDLYAATFSSAQLRGAKADYQTILNDGSLGGGSSGGGSSGGLAVSTLPDTVYLDTPVGSVMYGSNWDNWDNPEYTHPVFGRQTVNLTNKSSLVASLQTAGIQYVGFIFQCIQQKWGGSAGGGTTSARLFIFESSTPLTIDIQPAGLKPIYQSFTVSAEGGVYYSQVDVTRTLGVNVDTGELRGTHNWGIGSVGSYAGTSVEIPGVSTQQHYATFLAYNFGLGTGSVAPTPPTNWPESDPVEAPQPPDLPEPGDPVIDDEPDPTFPIYVDVSTTNYTADLQGVLDAMDDHCIHLQESIWWGFNSFWNKLYQYITWSVGVMRSEFAATRDYLHDLFQWLAEQFDYSVSGGAYNDSTVVSWLKRIYSVLGLGVNTRPSDPVADPDGIGDWLGQLFANFIAWLAGFGAGVVSGLSGDFAQLTHKFPFCVPWDIAAMLTLLVADPQAPSFDYPMYTLDSYGSLVQVATLEVDLSDFDSYMVGVRFMQKLLFCLYLAFLTPRLKEMVRFRA